jgi:hypothetical protein
VSRLPPDLVAPAAHMPHVPGAPSHDVLGLFPEPGARS